jgi:hypothetical protein
VAEFVPGYEASNWYGVGAPKATPAEVIDKLNKEINAALADPNMKASDGLTQRLRQAHRGRDREMGQGGEVRERQSGLRREKAPSFHNVPISERRMCAPPA